MSQAIVDPAELRRFAHSLKKFNQDLEERMTSLRGQLQALSATWRDQEQMKFAETFQQTTKALGVFVQAAGEHAAVLTRKATAIEQYLRQR